MKRVPKGIRTRQTCYACGAKLKPQMPTPREAKILRLREQGLTYAEVGAQVGLTASRVGIVWWSAAVRLLGSAQAVALAQRNARVMSYRRKR